MIWFENDFFQSTPSVLRTLFKPSPSAYMICLSCESLLMRALLMVVIPPTTTLPSFLRSDFSSNIKFVLLTGIMLIHVLLITSDFLTLLLRELSIDLFTSYALTLIWNSSIVFVSKIKLREQSAIPYISSIECRIFPRVSFSILFFTVIALYLE